MQIEVVAAIKDAIAETEVAAQVADHSTVLRR